MKKTLLFLLMFLAAEAKECVLESQKILIPWNVSAIQERAGNNNISVSDPERLFSWQLPSLRRLVYECLRNHVDFKKVPKYNLVVGNCRDRAKKELSDCCMEVDSGNKVSVNVNIINVQRIR